MKCAVIGSEGYIGRHLVYFLKEMGADVFCYDLNISSSHQQYKRLDVTDPGSLRDLNLDIDYLFVFSGITGTSVGFEEYERFVQINEIGLLNILTLIRKSVFTPHVVYPSTRLVYKGMDLPLKEEDPLEAKTIYAINKLACERLLWVYHNRFAINYTIFRICIPYGNMLDSNYSYGTIGFFLNQSVKKGTVNLYGDGRLKRTFTHIYDICNQIIGVSFSPQGKNEVFNIGGETFSLLEVATAIANHFSALVTFSEWPENDLLIESGDTYFDDTKILQVLGEYHYKEFLHFVSELN